MMESQSDSRSLLVRANVGPSAPAPTWSWNPFKAGVARGPVFKMVVPPLFKKCKVFDPLVDSPRYLAARDRARYEVKSISQTLGVGASVTITQKEIEANSSHEKLLDYISTAIFDASEDETHGIRDTAHLRDNQRTVDLLDDTSWVNIHSTLQEIAALQTTLDATEDEDEQRALEEDITGKVRISSSHNNSRLIVAINRSYGFVGVESFQKWNNDYRRKWIP
ncbi:hypothetical protein M404DRAFT_239146 [Pisolithus tinctorius Marx 270]|uniref:Uncharacterized protein n=1 Tax=Pisolithus tinctorius Marx 270 TaxID=870435 RepID=A0A0C3NML7_PISTI|nr:hypothetical protein M404DRAFT_239146 [Pisolithus tinctorius Marx 270]